ncbi:hypothetical protein QNM99_25400 [Pseudomonas sp. PCH446]
MIRAGVTDMLACVNTMEEMFGLLYAGDYRMAGPNNDSPRRDGHLPAGFALPEHAQAHRRPPHDGHAAYLAAAFCTAGVKWYGSNIANREKGLPRSILMFTLNDPDTGAPLAHMSANLLSAYRTGAIPGVARVTWHARTRRSSACWAGVMGKTTLAAFIAYARISTR